MINCNYTVNGKLICKEKFTNNSNCSESELATWSLSNLPSVECILKEKYGDETKGIIEEVGDCNTILKDLNEDQKQEVLNSLSSTLDDTSMTTIENKLCSINKLQNA